MAVGHTGTLLSVTGVGVPLAVVPAPRPHAAHHPQEVMRHMFMRASLQCTLPPVLVTPA